jgi:hypothetical protein
MNQLTKRRKTLERPSLFVLYYMRVGELGEVSISAGAVWDMRFALLLHFEYPFIVGLLHFQGKDTRLILRP